MIDDPARDRRLLCAANLTYDLQARPDPESTTFYQAISGLVDYHAVVGGWGDADAALLGVNDDEIILAFRGTQPIARTDEAEFAEALADWIRDFDADLVVDPVGGFPGWRAVDGRVHRDVLTSLKGHGRWPGLWADIAPVLDDLIARHPQKPLCITGHGKGGALAHLAALQCADRIDPQAIYVCTFAAPRLGDTVFAEAYEATIKQSYRYEYPFDLVPLLPPAPGFHETLAGHAAAAPFFMPARGDAYSGRARALATLCTLPVRGYVHVGKARAVADVDGHASAPLMHCLSQMIAGEGRRIADYHSARIGLPYANAVGLTAPSANT